MDQVGTVELTIKAELKVIHVYEPEQIVDSKYDIQPKVITD
ncbi:hypothetical protein [Solibacillus sp. FSL K6-1523]